MKHLHSIQILMAVVLGVFTGLLFGHQAELLGGFGMGIIQLIKILATPLIFFAILDGFLKTRIRAKNGLRFLIVVLTNVCIAASIALSITSLFPARPDPNLKAQILKQHSRTAQSDPSEEISRNGSSESSKSSKTGGSESKVNFSDPVSSHTLAVILSAIALGLGMRLALPRDPLKTVPGRWISHGLHLITLLLRWVTRAVPISVFCVISSVVGKNGMGVFATLSHFTLAVAFGILIQVIVVYSGILKVFVGISPLQFFQNSSKALSTAFGTGSSLATLPVTLETLEKKMHVSSESARLSACIGTNFNHVGILLYEAVTALYVAQLYEIHLDLHQKLILLGSSVIAAMGIAGVPDAGLITLSLVLSTVHLPLEILPVLLTVDWFIGRLRAMTNVTSDMVVAWVLDAWQSKETKWKRPEQDSLPIQG